MKFEPLKLRCPRCRELFDVDLYECPYCGCDVSHDNSFMSVELTLLNSCGGDISGERRGIRNEEPLSFVYEEDDYMDVYNTQCEYVAYLILKHKLDDYTNLGITWGLEDIASIRECAGFVFLINNGYLVDLTEEEFRKIIEEKFTLADLKSFMYDYGLDGSSDDRNVLLDILYNNDIHEIKDYLFEGFTISPEGLEFFNNPIFKEYEENYEDIMPFFVFKRNK